MDDASGLTTILVRRALGLQRADLHEDIATLVQQSLLDTLGVTLAGAFDEVAKPQPDDAWSELSRYTP